MIDEDGCYIAVSNGAILRLKALADMPYINLRMKLGRSQRVWEDGE